MNKSSNWNNKKTEALAEAVLALRDKNEAKKFLRDLLTADEIAEFGNRWQAAQMLSNKISYTTIRGKTGLSSATIARISSWLQNGMGGYRLMLNRVALHHHNSSPIGKGLR
jgi:TrpR-related protein YerC/YecD